MFEVWAVLAPYSASKWAVRGLTQASALELAPYGIRVNAYAPGLVDTKMAEKIAVESNREHAQFIAEESRNIPLKRLGAPDDVANLVSFLVSDKAAYITGQSVSVNGGTFFD
ncbi:NAD(P)-binding domain superfamily protein [Pleurotus pulmonarius]